MNFRTRILKSLNKLDTVHFCDIFYVCNEKVFTVDISGNSPARFWNCLATSPTNVGQKINLQCILLCFRLFILN
jgi:hypothetical protein